MSTAPLTRRDDLGNGYHVLSFGLEQPLAARAGHFAMVRAPGWGQAPLLPRPMSLLTAEREPSILIKVVGEGTRRMAEAPIGERYALLAPLGRPWAAPAAEQRPVLVAGGVGVAPLAYLARELHAAGHRSGGDRPALLTLYGGRTSSDLPLSEALEEAGELQVTTEDGSRGVEGRVTVLLERLLGETDAASLAIYTCGPHAMMAAVAALAAAAGAVCHASLEAPMGCGYGVCLGCAVARKDESYLYTCIDGPCVDAHTIDWSRGVF
jgi:dihydroorotate dehydrogenase electron transfer subunit